MSKAIATQNHDNQGNVQEHFYNNTYYIEKYVKK